jgi:hypothetical protein
MLSVPAQRVASTSDVSSRRAPGACAVKSRAMRSAKTLSGSEGIVVRLKARIRLAGHPFSAMIPATVPAKTSMPAAERGRGFRGIQPPIIRTFAT